MGYCVAARKYNQSFQDDCFDSFHDQERVSRISGIVPSRRRREPVSIPIPKDRALAPAIPIGVRTPPTEVAFERLEAPKQRKVLTVLLCASAFLMLTVALSFAHYL